MRALLARIKAFFYDTPLVDQDPSDYIIVEDAFPVPRPIKECGCGLCKRASAYDK